ncbi:unnamed protein product [Trifolium pratense]|uniref:Uncharacterized protein n=1 Tax=Trifolium pratense TaxID=57577 RepID=A0ACB0KEJ9_TRIPR|nr:unnamed protein product [Trifolium pratense]
MIPTRSSSQNPTRSSSQNHNKKMKPITSTTKPPSPLRRSERNRNVSSSSTSINNHSPVASRTPVSKRHVSPKEKNNPPDEEKDAEVSLNRKVKKMDARVYRRILTRKRSKECQKEINNEDRSTPEDSNVGGGKTDENLKETSLHCKEVFEDCNLSAEDAKATNMSAESRSSGSVKELLENNNATIKPMVVPSNSSTHETSGIPEKVEEETSQMLATMDSDSNESLIRRCVGNDKGGNLTPSKRKSTVVDKCSDVSATLADDDNCNLIVDADPERLVTSRPTKRIRGINNVDTASKSNDEKSCIRNKEGKSGDSVEKPQGNNVETEKIRKQQKSLHLSLKPEIAKLCEILRLPDNVKSMVGKFLEFTMNNYKICTEPVSILQAFQLSLCWTAASLLRHKFDTAASLILAKQHLNFDCKKDAVDEINAMLWDLKDKFLVTTENTNVNCSPKASESSNRTHSNTDITSDVEMTKKDISRISRNIKVSQKDKDQWRKLRRMHQENKRNLKKDLNKEIAEFETGRQIEWNAIVKPSMKKEEMIKKREIQLEFRNKFTTGIAKLKSKYDERLKDLETKYLEAQQKFLESSAPDELSNLVSSKELETPNNDPKVLLSDEVPETSRERATASELSREVAVGFPSTVSNDYPENAAPLNSSSTDQISDGGLDGVVSSRPCSSSSPSNSRPATIYLLKSPSTQQVPDRVLPTVTDGQIPVTVPELSREAAVGFPSTVRSTDCPDNGAPLNSSSTDQIFYVGLDGVVSSTPCSSSSPSNGRPATISFLNSPSSTQQVPGRVLPAITDGQIPVTVPENSSVEAECQLGDNVVVNESIKSDYQEVARRTMTENTLSQETPVSIPVDPIEPQEQVQVQPLSSVESLPSPVCTLPANQSNHVSMVMEPPDQVRQLHSSGILSSNLDSSNLPSVTGGEHRAATNEDALSSQIPEASTEVQNQAVEKPASNLEIDSHSLQVVPPVSNMVLDSLVPGGVRAQSSDTRNMSTHRVINSHPIQTPAQSASRNVQPFFYDPLNYELARIRKLMEQNMKNLEDEKLQLKRNYEKEFEELRRKYDIQRKEIEVKFQEEGKNYDTQYKTVYLHKILAETVIKANFDPRFSGASGMLQDPGYSQHLFQPSRQPNATWPSPVSNQYCRGPPATNFQNSHASTGSHTMVRPPIPASYNTSRSFSGFSARRPPMNSISSPSGNLQAGGEIRARPLHVTPYRSSTSVPASNLSREFRAPQPHLSPYRPSTSGPASGLSGEIRTPAPHLLPCRPSTFVPPSSLGEVPHGMPSQPAPGNSQWFPGPLPAISQFGPYRAHGHSNTGGFPTPTVSAMDMHMSANSQSSINLPNTQQRTSDLASLNHSQVGTSSSMPATSVQEATPSDVVCLSDDE